MPLYAMPDQDLHGFGINLSNLGPTTNSVEQKQKKKEKKVEQKKKKKKKKGEDNRYVQAVHSLTTFSSD